MIHRAPFGSLERFTALLIEHTAGRFPLWLAPEQAIILPISEKFNDQAKEAAELLKECDIRTIIDERNEKIGRKIRDAEMAKTPFMLILGEKEAVAGTLSVREHGQGDLGSMTPKQFQALVQERIQASLAGQ
jgi:threonyl-tRNA synthetase